MKKTALLIAVALPVIVFFSCRRLDSPGPENSGTVYLDLPDTAFRYYETFNLADSINSQATLGRVLFYDRHLSLNNSISCGSCHKQAYAFSDNTAKSTGFENRLTARNTPALQNINTSFFFGNSGGVNFNGNFFWDGRENDIRKLVARPVSNHVEMGMENLDALVDKLAALPYYKNLFQKAYGSDKITIDKISNAVAIFIASIKAVNTRFDQSQQAGNTNVLTALEMEGKNLFTQKYNCAACHNEQINGYFSGEFMNIGLDAPYTDNGLGAISNKAADNGKFKVPNLRNVTLTAPYMHDGRFKTLGDVLEHYSHGIRPDANLDTILKDRTTGGPMRMNISVHEKDAIIAFLGTLTDVDMVTNPNYADPFKIK